MRLCNRGQDFFFLSLFALARGCAEPRQTDSTMHLYASFYPVSLSRKKADRELLCSTDARSGFEGCGWEAKQKASQAVSVLTDPLVFSRPNGNKTKTTLRIQLSFQ